MCQKIIEKILELSRAGYTVSIHGNNLGYVLSIKSKDCRVCNTHTISYDEISLAGLKSYSLFIRELNAIMEEMGIDNIEQLKPDLDWNDFATFS